MPKVGDSSMIIISHSLSKSYMTETTSSESYIIVQQKDQGSYVLH